MKRRSVLLGMVMMAMLIMGTMPVFAASNAPKVESWEYKGDKKIEVEFKGDVQYKNAKVKVTDPKGKKCETSIVKKDEDDITFKVKNFKKGTKYQYTISGIRKKGSGKYTSVKGSFKVSADKKPSIKDVEYDNEDKEVNFEFRDKVSWKNAKVTITDSKGKNYVKKIKEKDNDEIEVTVNKLKIGKKYSYKIKGVARKGSGSYKTVTGTFTARDDD